jgi:hypothetical protein
MIHGAFLCWKRLPLPTTWRFRLGCYMPASVVSLVLICCLALEYILAESSTICKSSADESCSNSCHNHADAFAQEGQPGTKSHVWITGCVVSSDACVLEAARRGEPHVMA